MKHPVRKGSFFVAAAVLLVTAVVTATAVAATSATPRAHPCVVAAGSGDQAFARNFNPFNLGAQRDFTWGGIYENLPHLDGSRRRAAVQRPRPELRVVEEREDADHHRAAGGEVVGRQAADRGGRPLQPHHRPAGQGGRPDQPRRGEQQHRRGLRASEADKVAIRFKQVDSTFLGSQLPTVPIVPKRVWSKVKDVHELRQPEPRGLGPVQPRHALQRAVATSSRRTRATGRRACRGSTACSGSSRPRTTPGLLQIVSGQADWTHNFVPNVESAYMAKDPKNFHNAYLTTALPVSLTFNTTEYPYSLVAFRKGVSQAIDRDMVSKIGEYGYAPPTTRTRARAALPEVDQPCAPGEGEAARRRTIRPPRGRRSRTRGFTYRGSRLIDPKGNAVSFPMHVIGGWSDWVASLQIISRNLQAVGIDASVKIEPDWPAWVSNSAISGTKPSLIWSNGGGDPTPYAYFFSHFDPSQVVPTGQDALALGNFERNSNAQRGGRPAPVQGDARPEEAAAGCVQAAGDLPERAALHPAVHRPALVDVQQQVLQGLGHVAEPVRGPDLLDAAAGADLAPVAVLRRLQEAAVGACPAERNGLLGTPFNDRDRGRTSCAPDH